MTTRAIRFPEQLAHWVAYLQAQKLPLTVSAVKGVDRTNQQNRTFHMWCGQVSTETGDEADEVKGYCKAKFGLPIMKRDNPEWVAKYEPMYLPLPYDLRIAFFAIVPMTRLFKVPQMCEFMDAVQRHYIQQGMALIDPDPMKAKP
jgi:hypothetical protein